MRAAIFAPLLATGCALFVPPEVNVTPASAPACDCHCDFKAKEPRVDLRQCTGNAEGTLLLCPIQTRSIEVEPAPETQK